MTTFQSVVNNFREIEILVKTVAKDNNKIADFIQIRPYKKGVDILFILNDQDGITHSLQVDLSDTEYHPSQLFCDIKEGIQRAIDYKGMN